MPSRIKIKKRKKERRRKEDRFFLTRTGVAADFLSLDNIRNITEATKCGQK